ncbi:MAG: polymer-forming cytoskeletal protein [Proteobacteria bacterium]|nr:polymer-forming cytoskeletal protein [Pseudomonadota bacterium]
MFTRQSSSAAKVIEDIKTVERPFERKAEAPNLSAVPPSLRTAGTGSRTDGTVSIIGNDLTIVGQGLRIVTRGTLQVEGKIEGDVVGKEVIIGEKGQVTGVVSGHTVMVHGSVAGTVKGLNVALSSSAKVDGDVLHQQLSVEQGAHLEGRIRRPADPAELTPVLD